MPLNVEIRPEAPADQASIYALTTLAFEGRPYAGGDEQDVIERLRERDELTLSLVATLGSEQRSEQGSEVIGQITFSPATAADGSGPWFALGPVSVLPQYQGQGVGGALINQGLAEIESQGALGCILTGNPVYYRRFGFDFAAANTPENESAEYFMLKLLRGSPPTGAFAFKQAFYD